MTIICVNCQRRADNTTATLLRHEGWFIERGNGVHALCPPCTRIEEANADLGHGPHFYPMPGEHS